MDKFAGKSIKQKNKDRLRELKEIFGEVCLDIHR